MSDPTFEPVPDEPFMDASGPTDRNAPAQDPCEWPEGWDSADAS